MFYTAKISKSQKVSMWLISGGRVTNKDLVWSEIWFILHWYIHELMAKQLILITVHVLLLVLDLQIDKFDISHYIVVLWYIWKNGHMSVLLQKRARASTMTSTTPAGSRPAQTNTTVLTSANTYATPFCRDISHVCKRCPAAFVQFSSLIIHMASFHGEKLQTMYPDSCRPDSGAGDHGDGKAEENRDGARRHACDVCSKAFTGAGNLKKHKMIHIAYKPFVCDVCSKAFNRADNLNRHMMIHIAHRPFLCDVCSKAFNRAGHLKEHKRIHTGEKPYKCQHCDSAFSLSCALQRHIRSVHAGDRPHVCDVCGAAFSESGHLNRHKRIHTGERPHVCDVCGAAFSRTGLLKTHKRIHTGERPYVCDVCGKAFTDSSDFKTHQRSHTGEKPYRCLHCPAAFTRSGNLKGHVQKLHPWNLHIVTTGPALPWPTCHLQQ